ncbi:hypothetical protein [Streptomyces boluensis]|uniref:Uncharacterized protein n=1 Tax=Streptomyces boluensis TaxID=1775135 RepID=A0A964US20_9ACTN|nr:hypothetical protein [Streptomyces boluensis]NBE54393.1 hypothetical protein [Streptomyces boluensis]
MSAELVVGLVGIGVIVAGVVAVVVILRSGSILRPVVVHPMCATCGHAQPEHDRGNFTRCHHDYGHTSWNNDSYGNSQQKYGDVCSCTEFRHKGRAV